MFKAMIQMNFTGIVSCVILGGYYTGKTYWFLIDLNEISLESTKNRQTNRKVRVALKLATK